MKREVQLIKKIQRKRRSGVNPNYTIFYQVDDSGLHLYEKEGTFAPKSKIRKFNTKVQLINYLKTLV